MVVDNMPKWMSNELVILLLTNPVVVLTFTQSLIWIVAGLSLSIVFSILWCYFLLWGANIVLRQTKFKIETIAHTACVHFHWFFDTVYTCLHWFFDTENLTQVSFRLVCIVFYAMVMLIMEPSPRTLLAIICAHCMAVTGCILCIGVSLCSLIRKNFLADLWKVQWLETNSQEEVAEETLPYSCGQPVATPCLVPGGCTEHRHFWKFQHQQSGGRRTFQHLHDPAVGDEHEVKLISNGYDDDCDYESHDAFNELMMVMVMIMIVMILMIYMVVIIAMIMMIMMLLMILMTVMIQRIMAMISVCRSGATSPIYATDSEIAIRVSDDGSVFFYAMANRGCIGERSSCVSNCGIGSVDAKPSTR